MYSPFVKLMQITANSASLLLISLPYMFSFANDVVGLGLRFGLENKERSKEDQRHY